jgi:exosome complex component RRP42
MIKMNERQVITSTVERSYITSLLEANRRLDGRTLDEYRDIKIETGFVEKAEGSALVHLGNTKVIAGVKITTGTPYSDYPNRGTLIVSAELNPTAAPHYRSGPPSDETIELARITDRIIRESDCIDLEDLCIIEGKLVYNIFVDIYPIDDNGNLFDACALAAYAALATTNIPEYTINEEEVELLETKQPIKMKNIPISITTYKIGSYTINDASYKEEAASQARITFGFTENHIVSGQKGGEGVFSSSEILEIVDKNFNKAKDIREIVKVQLNKH